MKHDLKNLLKPWINIIRTYKITGITSDSRKVTSGYLFCALQGTKCHGKIFIKKSIKNGAIAILCETKQIKYHGYITYTEKKIPIIYFFELSQYLFKISSRYYKINEMLTLIGITGTNGKSTVAHMIAQWSNLLNHKIGIMGTLGNGTYNNLKPSKNTTESPINIQKFLKKMSIDNIRTIVMEVSSHGIIQNRVSHLYFSIAILTNITSDHLDYHKTIENYIQAKWTFFSQNNIKTFIININDTIGKIWTEKLPKHNTIVISIKQQFNYSSFKQWIYANYIIHEKDYTYIYFKSSWGNGLLKNKLIGYFNISNLLLAFATLLELGHSLSHLINTCKNITTVFGRMQLFKAPRTPYIIIDYAHNENALKNVLKTVRKMCHHNKIWCVFGCGGNRDKLKRFFMGQTAKKIANKIILTNDNPRYEKPIEIVKDIIKGCKNKKNIYVILDREKAINFAVINAKICDYIVILGKGHEQYQIVKNKSYYFSDHNIVKKLLENKYDSDIY
ncbi:MAG: UDP-N-acetylmuramoyl-L-alanyl-D-glutamate--2,6-diaminopimelate ligase [Buchnera aphidicola (Meitanaphis elongallis)]